MFACIWEYRVHPAQAEEFRKAYGPEGDWVRLFQQAAGYVRTDLFEDQATPGHFVSTDFWRKQQDWENMKSYRRGEYQRMDLACERLTEHEQLIGYFEVC